ncbi:extracellular matrix-binding ebh [Babesia caballi]|uniref:Extracellular matrix-binding ebh n=1 Tax=Babesia caballi TaxID=5871 RepID=A0AAV4LNI0_BABCB|nr:extracellular matrix-binding ebh [Babesia caballi]
MGFVTLVEGIGEKVQAKSGFKGGVGQSLETMFERLKEIVNDHENGGVNVDSLQSFLGEVFKGSGNERSNGFENLCEKLKALFGDNNIKSGMNDTNKHIDLKSLNNAVTDQAKKLKPSRFTNSTAKAIAAGVQSGAHAFLAEIKEPMKYTSYYNGAETKDVGNVQCAKIFLGCLPLYYQAFTYIYWRCDSKGSGEWETQTFGGSKGHHLKYFMFAMNYEASYLNNRRGSEVLSGAIKAFADFNEGMTEAQSKATKREQAVTTAFNRLYPSGQSPSNQKPTYPEFLHKLHENTKTQATSGFTDVQGNSLAAMYYCALCYFKCQQSKNVTKAVKIPSTIREMLYYLAAFPFSPNYDAFNTHVTEHFKTISNQSDEIYDAALMIPVADSGKTSKGTDTLSAADIKDYLTSTCMYSMSALGWLQGPGASISTEEPWLHELFCNTEFNLGYASGPAIFNTLSSCTYALQFQLHFLYQQCSNNGMKCGWQECRYGSDITGSGTSSLTSHICPGFKCQESNCHHNSGPCNHNKYGYSGGCGKSASTPSPLQAFLTDNLKGFSRGHPSDPSSHLATCSGPMCHVPMGFANALTKEPNATGWDIYYLLDHFCSRPYSPLRQLSEKLGCLTKRTPMTLGDVFGFIWTLNYQLFNNAEILNKLKEALSSNHNSVKDYIVQLKKSMPSLQSSPQESGLVKSLQTMAPMIPFLYQLFTVNPDEFLPFTLFNLAQHCHKVEKSNGSFKIMHENSYNSAVTSGNNCSSSPNDLWSLYQPVSAAPPSNTGTDTQAACRDANCGGYLSPLMHSAGATYAPVHASVYLSWLAYLTDDFHEWFQNLLVEFKNIDCLRSGCLAPSTCSHRAGNHGSSGCTCDSIVRCGSVLPLLYNYGFHYNSINDLNVKSKKSCSQFSQQLSAVIAETAPLHNLLSIDEFLYMFRFYFFYNLSTFWLCSLAILLYFILYGIDVLHFKSHVHFPSSHTVPPIGLLTTGKAPALTKLTYYMP